MTTHRITGRFLDYEGNPDPGTFTVTATVDAVVIDGKVCSGSVSVDTDETGAIDMTLLATGQGHRVGDAGAPLEWQYRATFHPHAGDELRFAPFDLTADLTVDGLEVSE